MFVAGFFPFSLLGLNFVLVKQNCEENDTSLYNNVWFAVFSQGFCVVGLVLD